MDQGIGWTRICAQGAAGYQCDDRNSALLYHAGPDWSAGEIADRCERSDDGGQVQRAGGEAAADKAQRARPSAVLGVCGGVMRRSQDRPPASLICAAPTSTATLAGENA